MGRLNKQLGRGRLPPVQPPTGGIKGFGIGVLKGAGSTAKGLLQLGEKLGGEQIIRGLDRISGTKSILPSQDFSNILANAKLDITPRGTAQKVGFGAEQIAEFLIPAGATSKAVKIGEAGVMASKIGKASKLAQGAAKLAVRSGVAAGEGALVTAAQTGGDTKEIKRNAIIAGAVPPIFTGLAASVKGVAGPLSKKIESSLIKATQADVKSGFKVENVFKYGLGGSLETTAKKTHEKISELAIQLSKITSKSKAKININDSINQVAKEISKNKASSFGVNTRLDKALDFMKDELRVISKNGVVTLGEAQQIKRSVGKLGAWQYGARDPESNAIEEVANKLYTKLRIAIEKSSTGELKTINQQLGELIPIETALIRRIPVATRNNAIGIMDVLTAIPAFTNPANLWLFAINKLARSGNVANALSKLSAEPVSRGAIGSTLLGAKGSLSNTEQNVARKVGNFIDNPKFGLSIEDVSRSKAQAVLKKNPPFELLKDMKNFVDYVRTGVKRDYEFEANIRDMVAKLGINPNKPNAKLADELSDILEEASY